MEIPHVAIKHGTMHNRRHTKFRAHQRYGVELNRFDLREIAKMCEDSHAHFASSRATFIEKKSNTRNLYAVEYKGVTFFVVYSSSTKTLVTVLPPDCAESAMYTRNRVETNTPQEAVA
jgi:hypothetical protein